MTSIRSLSLLAALAFTSLTTGCISESAPASMPATTPKTFKVLFETTCGNFTVECHREWAPIGADRFYNLLKSGFYKDIGFYRVMPNFVAQFGIHGNPAVDKKWASQKLRDDSRKQGVSNTRGRMTYATGGPNTRTTEMFINLKDNRGLDSMGFPPFAEVIQGMENVDKIYKIRQLPEQPKIHKMGNAYLKTFKHLDYIRSAKYLGT